MSISLAGRVLDDVGAGINGATVKAIPVGLSSPDSTTSTGTHANGDTGWWTITGLSDAKVYKIRVEYQSKVREFYGLSEVQFGRLVIGKRALEVQSDGTTYHKFEVDPTNGIGVNSPPIYLQGAYDSDPGGGVTVTAKKMGLRTTVASDGTYKLSILDDASTEKASFSSAGGLALSVALPPTSGGTGAATYTLGDTLYSDAANSLAKLAGNTTATKKFLRQTGTGTVSAAPEWDTVVDADLPATIVRTSRNVSTGTGLTGGGDLSADRSLSVVANTTVQKVTVRKNTGANVGSRQRLNFIEGSFVTLTVADDGTDDEVDITIAATDPSSAGYNQIQEEGTNVTIRQTLNFLGAALTAADATTKTNVTLSQSPSASTSVVGTGRTLSTTSPLAGGGDLSADRTLSLAGMTGLGTDGQLVRSRGTYWDYVSQGTGNSLDADTVDAAHAGTGANNVLKLDSSGNIVMNGDLAVGTLTAGRRTLEAVAGGGSVFVGGGSNQAGSIDIFSSGQTSEIRFSLDSGANSYINQNSFCVATKTDNGYSFKVGLDSAAKPTSNTWTIDSDRRMKKDIAPFTDGLNVLKQINPIKYRYNGLYGTPLDEEGVGVIAQDVETLLPRSVKRTIHQKMKPNPSFNPRQSRGPNNRVDLPDGPATEVLGFNSHELQYLSLNAIKALAAAVAAIQQKLGLPITV